MNETTKTKAASHDYQNKEEENLSSSSSIPTVTALSQWPSTYFGGIHLCSDEQQHSLPAILHADGIRYVSPYWIDAELHIGKKYSGKTLREVTSLIEQPGREEKETGKENSKKLENVAYSSSHYPSMKWWHTNLAEKTKSNLKFKIRQKTKNENSNADGPKIIDVDDNIMHNHIIDKKDVLIAKYHYHEQSVLDVSPTIVHQNDPKGGGEYIIVNKPAGIDVLINRDAGRVCNSLPGMLATTFLSSSSEKMSVTTLPHPAHRIDTPVSGLVLYGKSIKDAKRLCRQIEMRQAQKTYLARVLVRNTNDDGSIPMKFPFVIDAPLGFDKQTCLAYIATSASSSFNDNDEKNKKSSDTIRPSITVVTKCIGGTITSKDEETGRKIKTAVFEISPQTGRKHQIRCHLAHIGYPIVNDVRYGGTNVVVLEEGNISTLSAFGLPNPSLEVVQLFEHHYVKGCNYCEFANRILHRGTAKRHNDDNDGSSCADGYNDATARGTANNDGPKVNGGIWLHSWKYEFPKLNLKFESPVLPTWAIEAFEMEENKKRKRDRQEEDMENEDTKR